MITKENPHTDRPDDGCWQTVYWRGNVASGAAEATAADLQVFWNGYDTLRRFDLPREKYELERYQRTFKRIFEAGKLARSAEVLRLLGGK